MTSNRIARLLHIPLAIAKATCYRGKLMTLKSDVNKFKITDPKWQSKSYIRVRKALWHKKCLSVTVSTIYQK